MRSFILALITVGPCMAQLDEALTTFSARLPLVHETAFFQADKISPAWEPARLYTPPAGKNPLLGQFKSGDELTLEISELPEHDRILICLELVILCHWDGVWTTYGPDSWKTSLKDGPTLLETTFSNFSRVQQNFPDEIGPSTFPFQTAAASVGDLDFVEELGQNKGGWTNLDATYRVWLAVSHTEPSVSFLFSGNFHDDPDQVDDWGDAGENWAVKSCRVWAVPAGTFPDAETQTLATASLLSGTGKAPHPAAHAILVLSGTKAFPELIATLRDKNLTNLVPSPEEAPDDPDAIIAALASDHFAVRQKASQRLSTLLPGHREHLTEIADAHHDPEVSQRIRKALSDFDDDANPEIPAAPNLQKLISPRLDRLLRLLPEDARREWEQPAL